MSFILNPARFGSQFDLVTPSWSFLGFLKSAENASDTIYQWDDVNIGAYHPNRMISVSGHGVAVGVDLLLDDFTIGGNPPTAGVGTFGNGVEIFSTSSGVAAFHTNFINLPGETAQVLLDPQNTLPRGMLLGLWRFVNFYPGTVEFAQGNISSASLDVKENEVILAACSDWNDPTPNLVWTGVTARYLEDTGSTNGGGGGDHEVVSDDASYSVSVVNQTFSNMAVTVRAPISDVAAFETTFLMKVDAGAAHGSSNFSNVTSPRDADWTQVGTPTVDTSDKKHAGGNGSMVFAPTDHFTKISTVHHPKVVLAIAEGWAMDWWEKRDVVGGEVFGIGNHNVGFHIGGSGGNSIDISSDGVSNDIASGQPLAAGTMQTGVWVHRCISWDGSTWRVFEDGVQHTSWASSAIPFASNAQVYVGGGYNKTGFDGKLEDFRIRRVAVASNFTPPTAPVT